MSIDQQTYVERRAVLRGRVPGGAILLLGLNEAPRNYAANTYPFRQDSHLLYYTGIDLPDTALLILPDGEEIFFGVDVDLETIVWTGPVPPIADLAAGAGIRRSEDPSRLVDRLAALAAKNVPLHYLPPYRAEMTLRLGKLLRRASENVAAGASVELTRAVARQRSIKTPDEVAQIEEALRITALMYEVALRETRPGRREAEIAGLMQGVALSHERAQTFLPIVSVHGEIFHNTKYGNTLHGGELLLIDSGVESPLYYASDITRTIPVAGKFQERQAAIYRLVLAMQAAVIATASPATSNRELHLLAARTAVNGLKEIGLMQGEVEEAVRAGAHALFFPHGIGHMLGLDVHDMEDLGDVVGYADGEARSSQFGLSFLRLARRLEPGFVLTVEPGIYFIPALIESWAAEKRHAEFIRYEALAPYRGFGGIRIEDDILVTETGCRVLGPGIPKDPAAIEAAMAG
ncbi:MAG: aminopeptidase P family protein [Myxococcales bacterium]|nr:aminopeptidase P family protein [Myxococcales bacterium]